MDRARLAKVDTWIFDLDHTLYPPSAGVLAQVDVLMTRFIEEHLGLARPEAMRLRDRYLREHGITMRGLVDFHGVEPRHFLAVTHDIDLSGLAPDPELGAALARLPGRKVVHTNGPREHARRVLAALGLGGAFEAVHAIEDKGLIPKPERAAYDHVLRASGIDPARAAMIEDTPANLEVPKALGMATVWLDHGRPGAFGHVDVTASDLMGFLGALERA